mgnify:CR=1 FL=1
MKTRRKQKQGGISYEETGSKFGMAAALVLTGLAGCGSKAADPTKAAPGGAAAADTEAGKTEAAGDLADKEVVFIIKNLTTPFFLSMKQGPEDAGKDLGIKVTVQTSDFATVMATCFEGNMDLALLGSSGTVEPHEVSTQFMPLPPTSPMSSPTSTTTVSWKG